MREQLIRTVALIVKRATLEVDKTKLFDSVFTTVSELLAMNSEMVGFSSHVLLQNVDMFRRHVSVTGSQKEPCICCSNITAFVDLGLRGYDHRGSPPV